MDVLLRTLQHDIIALTDQISQARSSLVEAHEITRKMNRIDAFSNCSEYFNRIAAVKDRTISSRAASPSARPGLIRKPSYKPR